MDRSAAMVFARNSGLSVNDFQILRRKLRAAGAEAQVAKKTLVRLVAKQKGWPEIPAAVLDGPVFVAFSYQDQVVAAKALADFAKDHEQIKLIGGLLDGQVLSTAQVKELASMPSREELLAKFMGLLNTPLCNFAGLFTSTMSGFARAVAEYSKTK